MHGIDQQSSGLNAESRLLVTYEPAEFEKYSVEVQDVRNIIQHFRGIYGVYLKLRKENQKMSTCIGWTTYQHLY